MLGAQRDKALQDISVVLDTVVEPLVKRISLLEGENKKLQERITTLAELLQQKEQECQHTFSILKQKTSQWNDIKTRLQSYKSLRSLFTSSPPPNNAHTFENESMEHTQMPQEQTQLPDEMECLLDLAQSASDSKNESELETDFETQIEPENDLSIANRPTSNVIYPGQQVTKRKAHKRGCPCCDKFYQATRLPESRSFLQDAYDRVDDYNEGPSTPPGFWDVNFTPRG